MSYSLHYSPFLTILKKKYLYGLLLRREIQTLILLSEWVGLDAYSFVVLQPV